MRKESLLSPLLPLWHKDRPETKDGPGCDFDATVGIHPTAAEEFVTMRTPAYFLRDGERVPSL